MGRCPIPARSLRLQAKEETTRGGPLNSTLAPTKTSTTTLPPALDRALLCARISEENKAKNVLVLDMRGITPLYDFFVICTGSSRRQIHTIAEEIDAAMHAAGDERLSIQGYQTSRWVVQDYGDVVAHVFDPDSRTYYALEDLWADAPRIDWNRE
jgi:ribosome-associated protein